VGVVDHLVENPSAVNPATETVIEATWPRATPADRLAAARAVEGADPVDPEAAPAPEHGPARRWHLAAGPLLADARRAAARHGAAARPRRVPPAELGALPADPGPSADRRRRPVPSRPDRSARRGTRFHTWLEHRFGATHLLDIDDLPGAGDSGAGDGLSEADLTELQEAFEASPWARLTPQAVEVPFAVGLGRRLLRGRMD